MTNKFTNDFKIRVNKTFLKHKEHDRIVFEYIPRIFDIRFVHRLAVEKAKYVSSKSQNSEDRTEEEKINSLFNGIFAEMMVTNYLMSEISINPDELKWYDIERETFEYIPGREYDLKIEPNLVIDVRSSYYYGSVNIFKAFQSSNMDYIPKYYNKNKLNERMTDVSIRVLYCYVTDEIREKRFQEKKNKDLKNLANDLLNGKVKAYIVGFATKAMVLDSPYEKKLNQQNASYKTLPLKDGKNPDEFQSWIQNSYTRSFGE